MLQLSGLGDYASCLLDYPGDTEFCATKYSESAPVASSMNFVRAFQKCRCNPDTQWCDDDGNCVPFTAAEQAEWAATSPPPGKIATSPRPTWIAGVPNKTVMIGAGLAVAALLLLRR